MSPGIQSQFFLLQCVQCGAWKRFDAAELETETRSCGACQAILELSAGGECVVPAGFRTNLSPAVVSDTPLAPSQHRTITSEGQEVEFVAAPGTNLGYSRHEANIFRLNRGERLREGWRGFSLAPVVDAHLPGPPGDHSKKLRGVAVTGQLVDVALAQERPGRFKADPSGSIVTDAWLAAPKVTESLFLAPQALADDLCLERVGRGSLARTGVRAAAISATFLLVTRAAEFLDVDPEEFDVLEPRPYPGPGGALVPMLQFADQLVNGAGFCARLSEADADGIPTIVALMRSMVEEEEEYPLKDVFQRDDDYDHQAACDTACYRCLQRYGNRAYHGLLDWRLGLVFLQALLDREFQCGLDDDFSHPGLRDWKNLARRYAEQMLRFSTGSEVRPVGSLIAFRFDQAIPNWALITHPLWNHDELPGIVGDAFEQLDSEPGANIRCVDTFELARRQVRAREQLMQAWAS
jgi:hypothetical protein